MGLFQIILLVKFPFPCQKKPSNMIPQTNVIKFVLLNNKSINTIWDLILASLKHSTELSEYQ